MLPAGVIGLVLLGTGCADPAALSPEERARLAFLEPLGEPPLDPTNAVDGDPTAEWLGQALFFDPGLSAAGVSCADCHPPEHGFADPQPLSTGVASTGRHAPTLLNVAWQRWFFWDGRADTLWMQALGPIEHPDEMATSRVEAVRYVVGNPAYAEAFATLFGPLPDVSGWPLAARPNPADPDDPLDRAWWAMVPEDRAAVDAAFVGIGKALAAYERLLVRGDAPFDAFWEAEQAGAGRGRRLLADDERLGLKLFLGEARCHACHLGPALSNLEFHNLDIAPPPWGPPADPGRAAGVVALLASPFNAAGPYSDDPTGADARLLATLVTDDPDLAGRFKTPTLRNVAETAPYMHAGHFRTLEEVVRFYAAPDDVGAGVGHRDDQLFLPLDLDAEEEAALVAFLHTLTGAPLDPGLTRPPEGPPPG